MAWAQVQAGLWEVDEPRRSQQGVAHCPLRRQKAGEGNPRSVPQGQPAPEHEEERLRTWAGFDFVWTISARLPKTHRALHLILERSSIAIHETSQRSPIATCKW